LAAQLGQLKKDFPKARWVQYEPAGRGAVLEGAKQAFGEYVNTRYDFTKAAVILALDADFLSCGPGTLPYTRDFSDRRRGRSKGKGGTARAEAKTNRLYVVECMPTCTGAVADHRLALRAGQIEAFARALARELEVPGAPEAGGLPEAARKWLKPLADDLRKNR